MARRGSSSISARPLIIGVVLALFAISGLGAGFITRAALDGLDIVGRASTPTGRPTATAVESPTPSPTPTMSPLLGPSHFTFRATAAPRTVSPGQTFTISAALVAADGITPVANVTCYLRAPNGSPPLYTPWPEPIVSDATGQVIWRLTAPSVAPGIYAIEVYALGERGWSFHFDTSVTILA